MTKSSRDIFATEKFIFSVVNNLERIVDKRFTEAEEKAEDRFDKMMTQLVDIAGQFKKFGEEQTILSAHSSSHTDRIESLEKKVFSSVQT
jgi:hypothetical protein